MTEPSTVLDDPLMTPPSTTLETGTWDGSGSIRGVEVETNDGTNNIRDIVIEDQFEHSGLQCLLCRVTIYHRRGTHTQQQPAYGEFETHYLGCVHAPSVESFPKGYRGTYIADCYPDDNWFVWDERSWSNGNPAHGPVREWARRKTETLAEGLERRQRGESMTDSHQARLTDRSTETRVGHCKKDDCDVYIGRARGDGDMHTTDIGRRGWLGNPFTVDEFGREGCIERFRSEFEARLKNDDEFRAAVAALAGQTLGCWCQRLADDGPACHGEVIAEHADRLAGESDD